METLKFKTNIKCSGCTAKVTPFLNDTVGEDNWEVDLQSAEKTLTIVTGNTTADDLKMLLKPPDLKQNWTIDYHEKPDILYWDLFIWREFQFVCSERLKLTIIKYIILLNKVRLNLYDNFSNQSLLNKKMVKCACFCAIFHCPLVPLLPLKML